MIKLLKVLDDDIFCGQFYGVVGPAELKRAFIACLERDGKSITVNSFGGGNVFVSTPLAYESKNICKARKLLWFKNEERSALKRYLAVSREGRYKFIFATVNTGSYGKNNTLTGMGFKYVNTKLLFCKALHGKGKVDGSVYRLQETDFGYADLARLMKGAFTYSRFYHDANIPPKKADTLYKDWLKVLIAENKNIYVSIKEKEVAGFIVIDANPYPPFSRMRYGLMCFIVVNRKYWNQGIGGTLLQCAEKAMLEKNIGYLLTNTQATNLAAVNFYLRKGFLLHNSVNEYHWWKG